MSDLLEICSAASMSVIRPVGVSACDIKAAALLADGLNPIFTNTAWADYHQDLFPKYHTPSAQGRRPWRSPHTHWAAP